MVIVIAVIGILAAVLIPVFTKLIRKSKINSDTQLIRNLNTALEVDKVENEHNTMYDALEAAFASGYNITQINANATNNEILWDSANDVFCYLNDGEIEYLPDTVNDKDKLAPTDYRLWKIYTKAPSAGDTFSIYVASDEVATYLNNNSVNVGVDCGKYKVNNVSYVSTTGNNVVIRTNGGNLTINAPGDTVNHYGTAEKVDVVAVAQASYHENGTVQLIAVKEGHVKLEGEADVNGIYVYNNSDGVIKDTSFAAIKITVDTGVEVPKLSRSAVTIADQGTKVCTIVTDQAKDVYLFNEGIYEQIKTVDAGKNVATDASVTWADDNSNSANTQTAAQQLANEFNGSYDENGKIADKPLTVGETDYTIKFNEETRTFETYEGETKVTDTTIIETVAEEANVVSESGKTADEAAVASALKGSGTASDPFMVYDFDTMQKVSDYYNKGYYYFAVDMSKTDNGKIDCTGWVPVKLRGSFDGKNVKFVNVTAALFMSVGYQLENEKIVLKDFDATMNVSANGDYGAVALIKNIFNSGKTEFNNVNVHGYMEGFWNMGSYYNYGTANYDDVGCDYEVEFNDCTSDATLVCASGNTIGGLFGHAFEGAGHSFTLRVNNSEYIGRMFLNNSSGKGNKYFGMTSNYNNTNNHFYFDGVEDTFNNGSSKNASAYTNSTKIAKVTAVKGSDGYTIAKQSNVAKIVVTITSQLTAYDDDNVQIVNLSGITMTLSSKEIVDIDGSTVKVLDLFNAVNITKDADKYDATISNGKLNVKLASDANYKSGNIRLQVNQYDSTGSIVSAGTIDLATCANATSAWVIK